MKEEVLIIKMSNKQIAKIYKKEQKTNNGINKTN
jgi:hypothetical protein